MVNKQKRKLNLLQTIQPVSKYEYILPFPFSYHTHLPPYYLLKGKSVVPITQNQLKTHYILGVGQGVIAILIMSGQIAISLCSLRIHLLKEMVQMRQSRRGKID